MILANSLSNLLAKIEEMAKKWATSKPAPLVDLELDSPVSASSSNQAF